MSGTPIAGDYIKAEGKAGRTGTRLMAIVADGVRGRIYFEPTPEHEAIAKGTEPEWRPEGSFVEDARAFTPCLYGLNQWQKLFTNRQTIGMATFSDLVAEVSGKIFQDAVEAGMNSVGEHLKDGGQGAIAYGEAIGVYLSFCVSKLSDLNNNNTDDLGLSRSQPTW